MVQHGYFKVDVMLTWYNMANLGQMWVNVVEHD